MSDNQERPSDNQERPSDSRGRPVYHDVVSLDEARRLVRESLPAAGASGPADGAAGPAETVPLEAAAGRVLAFPIAAAEDVPGFHRSTVDGYAVRAADTFGATESAPVLLLVMGQVAMGRAAALSLGPGQAAAIPTGGMLPGGADAVVMVEHTVTPGEGLVEVLRPVAPGEDVVRPGEDVPRGAELFPAGRRLSPADLGVLAAVGVDAVPCRPRPRVAIIPTGDEIVPARTRTVAPGQVRDITSASLAAYVARDGGAPHVFDVVPDRPEALAEALAKALDEYDLILTLGGSSVGARDNTYAAIDRAGPPGVLFHGLALKPGKPTIFGVAGGRGVPVFGLPGHPVSGLVVYQVLVRLALRRLAGETALPWEAVLHARLAEAVPSDQGRDEYVCVRLLRGPGEGAGELLAEPIPGKSGLITMLARADGLVPIPAGVRGLDRGTRVEVIPLD